MVLALILASLAAEPTAPTATLHRTSRLAMGTVVGVTVVATPARALAAFDVAYAAIEAGEAMLSEWRPNSLTSQIGRGQTTRLPPDGDALLHFSLDLRHQSDGVFDVLWRHPGASLRREPDGWVSAAPLDLGGLLKGWLNDRAAAAIHATGVHDFVIDAAGDVLAAGHAQTGDGWVVDVTDGHGTAATVTLRDEALSTSGNAGQPGHVTDARGGQSVQGSRTVSVVAPSGMLADGLATAVFAGADPAIAARYGARVVVDTR